MAVTSGTVSLTPYDNRRIIDHSCRRAGYQPEKISAEQLQVALDCLFTITSSWVNGGFPLWTQEFVLLSCAIGSANVATPTGTVDVLTPFWRIFNPWRGAAVTGGGANVNQLFAGQPNSDVTIPGPNPSVVVNFSGSMEVDTIGVLLGLSSSPVTAALQLLGSTTGSNFTLIQTLPSTTFTPGVWSYFDLDPTISTPYLQILQSGSPSWILNQLNFVLANSSDIPLGNGGGASLNIDDYYNLPDKHFQSGQPNSAYVRRLVDTPVIQIWPTPNLQAFYNGTPAALMRRYIQDPGTMTNRMEVPQRWLEAIQWDLAKALMDELPPPAPDPSAQGYASVLVGQERQARYQRVLQNAKETKVIAWAEERTRGPIQIAPNISCYTK